MQNLVIKLCSQYYNTDSFKMLRELKGGKHFGLDVSCLYSFDYLGVKNDDIF